MPNYFHSFIRHIIFIKSFFYCLLYFDPRHTDINGCKQDFGNVKLNEGHWWVNLDAGIRVVFIKK